MTYLASHDEVVVHGDVGHQLHREEGRGRLNASDLQKLEDQPVSTRHVLLNSQCRWLY